MCAHDVKRTGLHDLLARDIVTRVGSIGIVSYF